MSPRASRCGYRLDEAARGSRQQDAILNFYGYDDLSDRLDLLAVLHHDHGDLPKAIQVLRQSQSICRKHGIAFDGEDILEEYVEKTSAT